MLWGVSPSGGAHGCINRSGCATAASKAASIPNSAPKLESRSQACRSGAHPSVCTM